MSVLSCDWSKGAIMVSKHLCKPLRYQTSFMSFKFTTRTILFLKNPFATYCFFPFGKSVSVHVPFLSNEFISSSTAAIFFLFFLQVVSSFLSMILAHRVKSALVSLPDLLYLSGGNHLVDLVDILICFNSLSSFCISFLSIMNIS